MHRILFVLVGIFLTLSTLAGRGREPDFKRFGELFLELAPAEAYPQLESWVFAPNKRPEERARRIVVAREVLVRGDYHEPRFPAHQNWVDPLLEKIEANEAGSWQALKEAARMMDSSSLDHEGALVEGAFRRGEDRGGPLRYSHDRDRVQALRLYQQAIELCKQMIASAEASTDDLAELYLLLAGCLDDETHLLDRFTDLQLEPELATREPPYRWGLRPEDVLHDGRSPVLGPEDRVRVPAAPASFAEATSDLNRQRWLLDEVARISPTHGAAARIELARLWSKWFGVEALVEAGYVYIEGLESELDAKAPGEFELHTLADDETFLVTSTGLRRMKIPPGFQSIAILQSLIEDRQTPEGELFEAYEELFAILANRRQFNRYEELALYVAKRHRQDESALVYAKTFLKEFAPDGRFLDTEPFVAGAQVEVEFLSRNVEEITLELWHLDIDKVLATSNEPENILRFARSTDSDDGVDDRHRDRLLPYYKRIKLWTVPVHKLANHLQSRSRLSIPVSEPGHYYLITRTLGKISGVSLILEETMLVGTPIDSEERNWLLLDSSTGHPVSNAEIISLEDPAAAPFSPDHLGAFSGAASRKGFLVRRPGRPPELKGSVDDTLNEGDPSAGMEVESFFVTNQPLYRPGQSVQFTCWVRQPGNRRVDTPTVYRNTEVRMQVEDPSGRVFYLQIHRLDDFGRFTGSFPLDPDIALGDCEVSLKSRGRLSNPERSELEDPFAPESWTSLDRWRVKVGEFRKPDFRVEIEAAPDPDGATVRATVRAFYNSGEPMVGAEILGELQADPTGEIVFPEGEFEWLYGTGYDWPLPRHEWMPDWNRWGIRHDLLGPTEERESFFESKSITFETTGATDEKGEVHLVFDAKLPLLKHFAYNCEVRAMVREHSGRSAVATKDFIHSGHPAELFVRPDKGFYRRGEEVTLQLDAMSVTREPQSVAGTLQIDRLGYTGPERSLTRQRVEERAVTVGANGSTSVTFTPPGPGQYQCLFQSGSAQRGIVLNVLDEEFDARDLRFNPIQLTPDHSVCAPGDVIELAIHCDRPDALVWVFQLMPDGRRQTPRLVQLEGKVGVVRITAPTTGAPNFQLMGLTAHHGVLHHTRCQISMPAREQVLSVDLVAKPESASPGDQLEVALEVRDHEDHPTMASLAVTAFDRSLEDLSDSLPKTRSLLPYPFEPLWGEDLDLVANRRYGYWNSGAFELLWEPGCFSDRMDFSGQAVRGQHSRFSKVGEDVWIAYAPPELPNSIGGGVGGSRAAPFGGIFPVTPATPSSYSLHSRPVGSRIDLELGESEALQATKARSRFADYAFWGGSLTTDAQGHAQVSFPLPENLTAWKVQSWAFGQGNQYGDAEVEIPVSKPLQLRPILPRSAVDGDQLTIAATVQNLSDRALDLHVLLEVRDLASSLPEGRGEAQAVTVPAGGEGLVSWPVELLAAGTAKVRFVARSRDGLLSDGTELPLMVAPRTSPVVVAASARMEKEDSLQKLSLDLTGSPEQATLQVRLSAQPAFDAFAAIPELVSYPFGCTEQTLNRFLPLLVASQTVKGLGGNWEELQKHVVVRDHSMGWIRGRSLHHVELASKPLTDEKTDILIRAGLKHLDGLASDDDAWGWFSGGYPSPYLTALALRGFAVAEQHGYRLPEWGKGASRSRYWLERHAQARVRLIDSKDETLEPEDPFVVYVLSLGEGDDHQGLQDALLKRRSELTLSGKIFLALALDPKEEAAKLVELLPSIHRGIERLDDKPSYYRWWQDPVEIRAWYLKLLTQIDRRDPRVAELVEHLLSLRSDGVRWKSTRDTALCIEAIAGTLSGDDLTQTAAKGVPVRIEIDGKSHPVTLGAENFWTTELTLPIDRSQLIDGKLPITIRREKGTPQRVRIAAATRYDADAETLTSPTSQELQVLRNYYLIGRDGERTPLGPDAPVTVGDLVEVELQVVAAHPRHFVHLTDPIPAGLEPVHQLSGHEYGAYREARLGETHLFISHLERWNNSFRYRCHAVTPGSGFALPAHAECMYAPAVFGSSATRRLIVKP